MNNLLQYLAESSLALLLFYAVYVLLLSRQTCFTFNRFYLLAALAFSLVIPFLELPAWPTEPTLPANAMLVQVQPAGTVYQAPIMTITPTEAKTLNLGPWLYGIYAIGVLAAIIFFCCQFLKLYTFIYSHAAEGYYWQRIKIIPTHGEMATFSFLHYILFDNSQPHTPTEKRLILQHEQAHLAQKHTFDILYLKILTIIFWFNPLLYFYKKALESTHEYLADAAVLKEEAIDTYATLLVNQVFHRTSSSFGNFFHLHQSLLLKRLTMMKKFNSPFSLIRPLLAIPVICIIAGALAANRPVSIPDLMPVSEINESSAFPNPADKRNIFTQSAANAGTSDDEISEPSFPNGKEQLYRFLLQHLKFKPEAFGKDAVRGTVVSIKIDKEGNPENTFAENEDLINQEINRVIRLMPRWIPAYQDGKALNSKYELQLLIDRKAKHSVITPNKLAKNGSLNAEGIPTFVSDIIHLGLNPVTGTPKNFLNQEAIVVGEITEPTFPGGQAAMERYFKENLNLGKVVGNELAKAKEFGFGSAGAQ
ncbi:M56 family metallopeptidase [Adhaeribacter rhizoryzae]|uniref:M56 family metallopeptidase n=1 Tax=Adhaeribacter rhizoryzae TaxID=2607907 RepID=A0A5M6DIQ5_9BACT|nr:M56 family metallopeptidase [Adhaeribacter rhizoryzae]KAA5547444.1 M56 family metallopeptidase [Adhaeribacter rhizoryzae]